ncbi:hypothetical protein Zmor_023399 [Zophobas morio]|uniref:Reverse transcriptase domain-containing protein n=1 Tax=Zophobas morio TaxID=2755281 RepID=A0AA38HXW5_9CUCU|nr:hypothetical protein Zmor_023399 [Zophobas morio]
MVNDNSYTVADIFADSFTKVFTVEPLSGMPNLSSVCNSNSTTDIKLSADAVSDKLRKLKVTKSPGPDLISACVLKNCAASLSTPLSILMAQSFMQSKLPSDWKTAFVKPLYKNKGDKFNASNYRPVSLASLVVKVMESIIYDHLVKFFINYNLISPEQHGFLPGKSVQSNLLCCLSDWTRDIDLGRPVDILYLDFSKAFDKVPKRRLLHKLKHLGIRGNLLGWIDSFLSDRTFRVKVGDGFSRSVDVVSGVPQGSVLGPLLFVAYTADVKNNLAFRHVRR